MQQKKVFSHIFLTVMMIVALFVISSSALLSAVPSVVAAAPDHITLTWVDDPRTTQTITWRTDVNTSAGLVQYVEATAGGAFPAKAGGATAAVQGLSTNLGDASIHSVTLTGLKPGTRYRYRVGDGASWSEPHTFVTAATTVPGFKFLVFGDSQSSNYDVWRATIHRAYEANPDAVFLTNVGDLVDVGQDFAQWNGWFAAAQGVVDTIPAMPVTGNHESYTPERQFSLPVYFTAQFKLPLNGPEALKGQVYSFDYGDVHFIMLDSQENEEKRFVPAMLENEKAWLEEDLRAANKKWKVVFMHRPPYNNKTYEANDNIQAAFVPIFDKYHVDVVFTGHDHTYARTYALNGGAVVDSPARGTLYVATGRSGTKTYTNLSARWWNEFFYNPLDEPNYIAVQVKGDSMTVEAVKQSGVLIDSWTVDKAVKH